MNLKFRDPIISGWPTDIESKLNQIIGGYKLVAEKLKIGITGNPESRANDHAQDKWQNMVVIYETTSQTNANTLENWLVATHSKDLTNKKKGGGSNNLSEKTSKYYLYVLYNTK